MERIDAHHVEQVDLEAIVDELTSAELEHAPQTEGHIDGHYDGGHIDGHSDGHYDSPPPLA